MVGILKKKNNKAKYLLSSISLGIFLGGKWLKMCKNPGQKNIFLRRILGFFVDEEIFRNHLAIEKCAESENQNR